MFHRLLRICSHAVAVANKERILDDLVKGVRVAYRSSITYPETNGGAGRKGGRKRKGRVYLQRPEVPAPSKRGATGDQSPFTEIWHNNEPLIMVKIDDIPLQKNACGYCGREFPRGFLCCIPFDVALSHRERWEYFDKDAKEGEPRYKQSPYGKKTTRYYCISNNCIFNRFPYFQSDLFEKPEDLELRESHKKLLSEQLSVYV